MSKYYDKAKIKCLTCKHLWILVSDETISDDLHEVWCNQVLIEHEKYHTKWKAENE